MIARVANFEGLNAAKAQKTMDKAESIVGPMMERLPGYRGHIELVAPNGKGLSITMFDSEADANAAEATFDEEMPRALGDLFKDFAGRRVAVDRYEVAAMAEAHT